MLKFVKAKCVDGCLEEITIKGDNKEDRTFQVVWSNNEPRFTELILVDLFDHKRYYFRLFSGWYLVPMRYDEADDCEDREEAYWLQYGQPKKDIPDRFRML